MKTFLHNNRTGFFHIHETQLTLLLLTLAAIFGSYVRILAPAQTDFPILDGGLFYSMTRDLISNGFRLPLVTSYNHLNIPFAYPPLALYLAGFINFFTGAELLGIFHWLPVAFSLLTIPAFYLLGRELLEAPAQAALATLIFALLPRSYDWLVMGGGITRAPATLFLILFLWACYRAFAHKSWKMSVLTAVFGGLVLLSHPERALHAATAGLLFWLWLDRSRSGTGRALVIGGGTLLISAPWWAAGLFRYGAQTLLLAAQAGSPRWLFWVPLLQLDFTDETIPIAAFLSIFGAFICWKQRKGLLVAWFVLAFLTDPRSAPHIIAVQVSLLASIGLTDIIFPALEHFSNKWQTVLEKTSGRLVLGYVLIVMLFNAQSNLIQISKYLLAESNQQALDWVAAETPPDSHFLVLDWQKTPMLSPLLEWFPALSERMNIVTIQGREWLPGVAHFAARIKTYPDLYACLDQDTTCLNDWATQNNERFDYVYISIQTLDGGRRLSRLSDSLRNSNRYRLVYETSDVLIFKNLP